MYVSREVTYYFNISYTAHTDLKKTGFKYFVLINETRCNTNTMKLRPLISFKRLYVFICKHSLVLVLCVSPESKIISIILVIIIMTI